MPIKPLLENAIWHGLIHKKNDRKIDISVRSQENQIICSIEDNGIGRAYAKKINGHENGQNSMALKLFAERLKLNNQLADCDLQYEIIDLYKGNEASGTKINLFFAV